MTGQLGSGVTCNIPSGALGSAHHVSAIKTPKTVACCVSTSIKRPSSTNINRNATAASLFVRMMGVRV